MSKERKMELARKDSSMENILASYFDERGVSLSENEEELKKRYEAAFTMLIDNGSIMETVMKLEQLYDVSKSTAYRYVNNSELIFGNVKKFHKDAWKYIQIERKRRYIELALQNNDLELVEKFERQIDNLIGFEKDDLMFNPKKLEAMNIEITMDPATQKAFKAIISKGVVDFNRFEAEDIPHEEVKDE